MHGQQSSLFAGQERKAGRKTLIGLFMALVLCVAVALALVPQQATADDAEEVTNVASFEALQQAIGQGKTNIAVRGTASEPSGPTIEFTDSLTIDYSVTLDISGQYINVGSHQIIVDDGSLNLTATDGAGSIHGKNASTFYESGVILAQNNGSVTVGTNAAVYVDYVAGEASGPAIDLQKSTADNDQAPASPSALGEDTVLDSYFTSAINVESGTVTVNGGTVSNGAPLGTALIIGSNAGNVLIDGSTISSAGWGIFTASNSTASLTIKNSTMTSSNTNWCPLFCLLGGTTTIQSGVFTVLENAKADIFDLYNNAALTIDNGQFAVDGKGGVLWTAYDNYWNLSELHDPVITINDGTFKVVDEYWSSSSLKYFGYDTLDIYGGTATINNGTFTSEKGMALCAWDSNVIINDGSFTSGDSDALYVDWGASVTVNGGNFTSTGYDTLYVLDDGSLVVNGGSFVAVTPQDQAGSVEEEDIPDYAASLGLYPNATSVVLNGGYFYNGIAIWPEEDEDEPEPEPEAENSIEDAQAMDGIAETEEPIYTTLSQLLGKDVKYYNLVNDKPTTVYTAKDVTKTAFTQDAVTVYKEALPMTGDWLAKLFS